MVYQFARLARVQVAKAHALPKYVAVSEMLIREIAAGLLADGARLPPERDMADEFGISVGTLRKALADLHGKGLLDRVQGSGNYVRHKPDVTSVYSLFRLEKPQGGGLPTADVISVAKLAKPEGAPWFGADPQAHRIRRLRLLDDSIAALEEIWLDASVRATVMPDDLTDSLYQFYRDALGMVITRVEDRVGVAALPTWTPKVFAMSSGTLAGFVERVSWRAQGDAVEYSRTWFDTDKARYVARLGKG